MLCDSGSLNARHGDGLRRHDNCLLFEDDRGGDPTVSSITTSSGAGSNRDPWPCRWSLRVIDVACAAQPRKAERGRSAKRRSQISMSERSPDERRVSVSRIVPRSCARATPLLVNPVMQSAGARDQSRLGSRMTHIVRRPHRVEGFKCVHLIAACGARERIAAAARSSLSAQIHGWTAREIRRG